MNKTIVIGLAMIAASIFISCNEEIGDNKIGDADMFLYDYYVIRSGGGRDSLWWNVHDSATWESTILRINNGGNNKVHTVTVLGDITVSSSSFSNADSITVILQGAGTVSLSGTGSLLSIRGRGDATLILNGLTLKGHSGNISNALVSIGENSRFYMKGNASVTGNGGGGVSSGGYYSDTTSHFIMQNNASVTGNGAYGVSGTGNFTMQDSAAVSDNGGNGVFNIKKFNMLGGKISGNAKGGVVLGNSDWVFAMKDGIISNNTGGSGVSISGSSGIFTMDGGKISGNDSSGVSNSSFFTGSFIMNGGEISNNDGNGVFFRSSGYSSSSPTFTMNGGTISGNIATDGGGVNTLGNFTMNGGTISGNIATRGGGVYYYGGSSDSFAMTGGAITGNTAKNSGGGVYNGYGTFTMKDGTISGNTAHSDSSNAYGGGVYNGYGTFTMKGGAISNNTVEITGDGYALGGGVYYSANDYGQRFTMEGGTISGNSAKAPNVGQAMGGGICRNWYSSSSENFTITGGTIYGIDASDLSLRNTVIPYMGDYTGGHAIADVSLRGGDNPNPTLNRWRNDTADSTRSVGSTGFWTTYD